jgi:hypothetical protein
MDIIKLPLGELAPKDVDCISIDQASDGTFVLNTSALAVCAGDEEMESTAVIGSEPYPSYDAAEAAGLAIAAEQCVETVYISRQSGMADT